MSKNDKKNKRGVRGSVEEETNEAKRPFLTALSPDNMAGTKSNVDDDNEDEPTLAVLRDMLADLQQAVKNISKENRVMKDEITDIKTSLRQQGEKFNKMEESLSRLTKENNALRADLKQTKERLIKAEEETQQLWSAQDDLEQYTRKNSLEIVGVPEGCYTTTEEVVLKIANALDVNISPSDIEISHKLKRKGANIIIAKFVSHKVKTKLYKERVKLKNVKLADLFLSFASATNSNHIYINENLTNYRRYLMGIGREKKHDGELISIWTIDGKVFVKTSPYGAPIRIFHEDDFEEL